MKSLFLFLAFCATFYVNIGFAQGTVPALDRSYRVTRFDPGSTVPGYANTPVTLTIRATGLSGSTPTSAVIYPQSNTTQRSHFSTTAILYAPYTFKITGMFPGNNSNWYSLPTTIGDEVLVSASDFGMTYHSGGYGYSVTVKCVGIRLYEMRPTRFECYTVPCPFDGVIPTSASINLENSMDQAHIYPNPVNNEINLTVFAATDQSSRLVITDILGRKVITVDRNLKAGNNTVQIAAEQLSAGNYFVNFIIDKKSSTLKFSKI